MKNYYINIEKQITITEQDIDDIMCSALDGGITYWCNEAEVVGDYLGEYASEQISRGGTLKLHDADDYEVYELTLGKLLEGIQKAADGEYFSDYNWIDGSVIDACQVDAEVADAIIQCAIFGDVIYG